MSVCWMFKCVFIYFMLHSLILQLYVIYVINIIISCIILENTVFNFASFMKVLLWVWYEVLCKTYFIVLIVICLYFRVERASTPTIDCNSRQRTGVANCLTTRRGNCFSLDGNSHMANETIAMSRCKHRRILSRLYALLINPCQGLFGAVK